MITYADPSALVGTLLSDAPDADGIRALLETEIDPVMVSELALVEVASACMAAERGSRITDGADVLAKFESWCAPGGRIRLIELRRETMLRRAILLTQEHRLYALDAIHVAVALDEVVPLASGGPVRFLTRDRIQADAARSLGFTVG